MSGYLGPTGGLEALWFSNDEPESREARHVKRTALSGRVTAQRLPRPRRTWSCGMGESLPEDYAALEWMSEWLDPLVWYSALACKTNILTPGDTAMTSQWSGGDRAGAGTASDGTRYLASLVAGPGETITLDHQVPVPNDQPVTASAYVSTHPSLPATLEVEELDPEGAVVTSHAATVAPSTHAERAAITVTTSVRTVALTIRVNDPLMVTMPAVTLTESLRPWSIGRGCRTAAVDIGGESHHFGLVAPDGEMRVSERTFTIHELG